ncbi:COPII coat GTPase [Cladorrhinum sp. PSN259]|nr:COPII coat GTPase [Cladorrhinum sp. PSN259]
MSFLKLIFDAVTLPGFGVFKKQEANVLLLGLDNAGKTTLLQQLKHGDIIDLGGHRKVRGFWRYFLQHVNATVFVVDASDLGRLEEAKEELIRLLAMNKLRNVPIAVLLNKIDVGPFNPGHEVYKTFRKSLESLGIYFPEVFVCSFLQEEGYQAAFQWLKKMMDNKLNPGMQVRARRPFPSSVYQGGGHQ